MIIKDDSLLFYNPKKPKQAPLHYKLGTCQCIAEHREHAEEDEKENTTVKHVYIRASIVCNTGAMPSTFKLMLISSNSRQ